jgi:putative ubiquitin-RnfH superfamily antitoxin RatB of RatAB toxin-antitoxin module
MRFASALMTFMEENNKFAPQQILVEVAYAKPDVQVIVPVYVDKGTTLGQAVEQSGILQDFPEIDLAKNKVGIFGKVKNKDVVLREKDRVEIYRPLIADPKEIRKQRAAEGKVMKKGGGSGGEAGDGA